MSTNFLFIIIVALIVAELMIKITNNVEKLSTEDKEIYANGKKKAEKYTKKEWIIPVVGIVLYVVVVGVSIGLMILNNRMESVDTLNNIFTVEDTSYRTWRTFTAITKLYIFAYFGVRIILYLLTKNKIKKDSELTEREKELVIKYKYSNWVKYTLYCVLAQIIPIIIDFMTQLTGPGGLY